jgi:hypothetical protein
MYNVKGITADGAAVFTGTLNFIPRIGEKVKSNSNFFTVEDVIYDLGYGHNTAPIQITIRLKPWDGGQK